MQPLENSTRAQERPAQRRVAPRPRPRSHRRRQLAVLGAMTFTGLMIGLVLLVVGIFAPYASVTLTPTTTTVTAELTYGVAAPGRTLDLALEPRALSQTLSYESSIPTTGLISEPDGFASGEVLFTNPMTSEILVPSGTYLTGPEENGFITQYDVIVPSADPFGTLTLGSTTAEVFAAFAGAEANLEAGAISGQLETGVFFTNREPMSGGSSIEVSTVAPEDVQQLTLQAEQELLTNIDLVIASQLTTEEQLLEGTVQHAPLQIQFDHGIGDAAETLTITSSVLISALAYNELELHELAEATIEQTVLSSETEGQEILLDSVRVSEPRAVEGSTLPTFSVDVTATSQAIIDTAAMDQLQSAIVGARESEAQDLVGQLEDVGNYSVEYGPDWLPFGRVPRLKSRIDIEVKNDNVQASQSR